MDYIKGELTIIVKKLEELYENYTQELSKCPDGRLINNKKYGSPVFYHAVPLPGGKYQRTRLYPGTNDDLMSQLARKEYLSQLVKPMKHDISALKTALARYQSLDPAYILNCVGRAYRFLPSKSFFGDSIQNDIWNMVPNLKALTDDMIKFRCDAHREWADEEYEKNSFPFPEGEVHLTSFGLRVRSRGEIMIAERLYHFGVPNRYDQIISLNKGPDDGLGNTLIESPDFSFQDRNYEEFYIEYCGMMDDPDYVRKHLIKRSNYERNGIVPWKNICYIYSTGGGFNVAEIDSIILNWVIPRL